MAYFLYKEMNLVSNKTFLMQVKIFNIDEIIRIMDKKSDSIIKDCAECIRFKNGAIPLLGLFAVTTAILRIALLASIVQTGIDRFKGLYF